MNSRAFSPDIRIETYDARTHRDALAHLFVKVESAAGDEVFREQVRTHGLDGAYQLIDKEWFLAAVALIDDEVVGFAALAKPSGVRVEMVELLCDPEWQAHGVGTHLITAFLDNLEQRGLQVWVDVLESSTASIRFFERFGFRVYNHRVNELGQVELLMEHTHSNTYVLPVEVKDYDQSLLDEVARLYVKVDASYGRVPWSKAVRSGGLEAAKRLLSVNWYATRVAYVGSRIVGFAGLTQPKDGRIQLTRIMVDPDYRGHRVATKMITELIETAEAEKLQVWLISPDNVSSIKLYEFSHFSKVESARMRSGRPGVLMERPKP